MRFTSDHLTLWYGTDDAPAPLDGSVQGRQGVSVTVAVQPPNPSNVVSVRYRVDGGSPRTAPGVLLRTDFQRGIEYHRTVLPDFRSGDRVSYLPALSCAGRSIPRQEVVPVFPSSFRVADPPARTNAAVVAPPPARQTPPAFELLASIRVPLNEPEVIGETPDGLLVNWFWSPNEGTISGPVGNGKVRKIGGDWMTIRRDGVGVMNVRATVETEDGALLYASYLGSCDFGEDGYQRFLDRRWPDLAPTRTAPRILTSHPKYLWLNRVQCVGIGVVHLKDQHSSYDLYALR
jgi:hypothetical protein